MAEPTKEPEVHETAGPYFAVYGGLLALTALAILSSFVPMGAGNGLVVLGIAICKALATLWVFMHVRQASRVLKLTILAGVFTLAVLFVMTYTDYASRTWGSW